MSKTETFTITAANPFSVKVGDRLIVSTMKGRKGGAVATVKCPASVTSIKVERSTENRETRRAAQSTKKSKARPTYYKSKRICV